jgi:hypothetical protein
MSLVGKLGSRELTKYENEMASSGMVFMLSGEIKYKHIDMTPLSPTPYNF